MRVLVYCPLAPEVPGIHRRTLESIFALDWAYPAEIVFGKEDRQRRPLDEIEANRNITKKYNQARAMLLAGDYDALLTVESDMIIPPNALKRLSAADVDVAYGLYVSRHGKHPWLTLDRVTEDVRGSHALGETWEERGDMWLQVVTTAGVGLGCTLIRRHVLEAIPFRVRDEMIANDWYFAIDVREAGFTQAHDCGVICGHIEGYQTYWPDVAKGYRADEPSINIQELIEMARGKYIVLNRLSMADRFAEPGEEVELDEAIAEILLKKRVIKPAERAKKDVEVNYDTDD